MNTRTCLTLALLLTACGSEKEHAVPVSPPIQVKIEPSDLMTSVRGSTIRVVVGIVNLEIPEQTLEVLKERISLTSEGKGVPFRTLVEPPSEDTPQGRAITVVPTTELSGTWHELRVDLRDTGVDPYPALHPVGDGTFFNRFHPDSEAVVQLVRFCPSAEPEAESLAILEFSEPVDFVPDERGVSGAVPVVLGVDGIDCRLQQTVSGTSEERFNMRVEFGCALGRDEPQELSVSFLRELKTRSGDSALFTNGAAGASSIRLGFASGYDIARCKGWHLP